MKKKRVSKKRATKTKTNSFSLKDQYKQSWSFLKESRNYILFTAGLFFIFSTLVFLGLQDETLNKLLIEELKKILLEFEGLNTWQMIVKIFLNNVFASLSGILFGIFLGIAPVVFIIVNSYMLGFVMDLSVQEAGWSVLWRLLPHGIFELPAIIISFALGIKLGSFVFAKEPWAELRRFVINCIRIFFFIVIPLLVIAAIIEGILIGVVG